MVFYAFDLLYLDGYDLTKVPLHRAQDAAGRTSRRCAGRRRRAFSAHLESDGEAMFRHACRLGLEGIISKRKDRPYIGGRGTHWLKTKCTQRQEFVIAGYVPSTTSGKAVGSLVMGVYEGGRSRPCGTGRERLHRRGRAQSLWRELEAFRRPASPFAAAAAGCGSRRPLGRAEACGRGGVSRMDGRRLLRHVVIQGLRDDKDPTEVEREIQAGAMAKTQARTCRSST